MADAIPPTSPTAVIARPSDALGGATINVGGAAGDLQTAINASVQGDTLVCPAGAVYSPIVLPARSGSGWTCIRVADDAANLPLTQRVPASGANMFKVQSIGALAGDGVSPNNNLAVDIPAGSNGWRFIGMEATHPNGNPQYGLIYDFGNRTSFERCYAHRHAAQTVLIRCFYVLGNQDFQLWDSQVDCRTLDGTADSQTVFFRAMARGHIENSGLSGPTEVVMVGDQDSALTTDITIKRSTLEHPLSMSPFAYADGSTANPSWDTVNWAVKNCFEIKYASRLLFEGNTCDGAYGPDQPGDILVFNGGIQTDGRITVPRDCMIRSNIFRNAVNGFALNLQDLLGGLIGRPERLAVLNNLFHGIRGHAWFLGHAGDDYWIEHNTIVPANAVGVNYSNFSNYVETDGAAGRFPRLTIKRNIWGGSQYGVIVTPDSAGVPTLANWNTYLGTPGTPTGREIAENAELAAPNGVPASGTALYPGGAGVIRVFANAAAAKINPTTGVLDSDSTLKAGGANAGSDSKDLGVDFVALQAAIDGDPPLPSSTFTAVQTPSTLTMVFTNTSSGAPFTAHDWDFGDGSALVTTENASHTYATSGERFVTHRVTNAEGQGTSGPVAINVTPPAGPPTLTITGPTSASTLAVSSPTIILSGTATDVTSVTWANTTTEDSGVASGLNLWETEVITLQAGANALVVTGHGLAPNAQDPITVTYAPATPLPPDLMRGFGSRGVASTDAIVTPLTAHAAQRTILFWYRRDGAGDRCLFTKSSVAIQALTEAIYALSDGLLRLVRQYSGGAGEWTCPAPVAGARHCLVVKIDTGAPTALPIVKIDNVIQTLTVVRQPGGGETPVSNAAGYMLGNWTGGTGSVQGDLAKWTVYNRLTTDQEDTDFYEGDNPMTIGVAPVAYHVLDGTDADEPSAVSPFTDSVVTGTQPQNYAVVAPPTVTLSVTSGNPATGTAYQVTAEVVGEPVNRVELDVDSVLTETRTVAPYLLFDGATGLLGPGPHAIVARVYETAGATVADTDTLLVTEPSVTSGTHNIRREICDRVDGATSYKFYIAGVLNQTIAQPAFGNPEITYPVTGADTEVLLEWSSVTGGVESAKAALREHYTDPSATPPEGITVIARAYNVGANEWTATGRCERKDLAVSYDITLDGSGAGNVLQPGSGRPTFVLTFAGASVEKTIGVTAVFAGGPGPRGSVKFSFVAPATGAPTGGQELSRTYTP